MEAHFIIFDKSNPFILLFWQFNETKYIINIIINISVDATIKKLINLTNHKIGIFVLLIHMR